MYCGGTFALHNWQLELRGHWIAAYPAKILTLEKNMTLLHVVF